MSAAGTHSGTIYLASRSPRRRELLAQHGITARAEHPGIDDAALAPTDAPPEQWVAALAYLKARAGQELLRSRGETEPCLILGADTTCVKGKRLLGTPRDAREAREMIVALEDGEHRVLTGVALIDTRTGTRHLFTDTATVRVGALTDAQIDSYIASGKWAGKAGAYNLDERIAAGWPITYVGDPGTIMGLPMKRLAPFLQRLLAVESTA